MDVVREAIPFLFAALIVGLVVRDRFGRMPRRAPKPKRPPRPKRSHLSVVPRDRMDDELQDLLKRR
ncbi:MAG TPA: hypothetical protein VGN14_16580 [Candidatus Elarobacter sp.]